MTINSEALQSIVTPSIQRISILGATGSVGQNTLDLIGRNRDKFSVVALTAQTNVEKLAELSINHNAEFAVIGDDKAYSSLKSALAGTKVEAAAGREALIHAASLSADWTMAAIVGAAGLQPTLAAIRQGNTVALANKECLVCAGNLFMNEVSSASANLLPVDSEHSAIFQSTQSSNIGEIDKITLTASGGPFLNWPAEDIQNAQPEDALRHPTWSMGAKISIDSATMMNKGLELIEAFHLFPVVPSQLEILVHPESIVHGLVSYRDGSVLAQLGTPDMRTPIAYSLAWPNRMETPTERLDLAKIGQLTFFKPDENKFPCLRIAREILEEGAFGGVALNAANEIAVEAFLNRTLSFAAIPKLIESVLNQMHADSPPRSLSTIEEVLVIDEESRKLAQSLLNHYIS
ncbi:MAG: 1-deoxy-D-xylulose-5-phosphate reductoisomerase [Methyloligellaceae bacterium]